MYTPIELRQTFLAELSNPVDNVDDDALATLLKEKLDEATTAWPQLETTPKEFMVYLAERTDGDPDVIDRLQTTNAPDLYLACGCTLKHPKALRVFAETYESAIMSGARRIRGGGVLPEDVKQQLLEYLLLPRGERAPAITLYAGQGSLKSYLSVASMRRALKLFKKNQRRR